MRVPGALAIWVCAGCLSRPSNASPDAPPHAGADAACAWDTTPTILKGQFGASDDDNGPWLSPTGSTLWFTLSVSPTVHDVEFATSNGGTFDPATIAQFDNSNLQDDPYVDHSGTLWWSGQDASDQVWIWEADETAILNGTSAQLYEHAELGAVMIVTGTSPTREPALGPDGLDIYFTSDQRSLDHAHRAMAASQAVFDPPETLASSDPVESPSVGPDGKTIYVTDHIGPFARIMQGTIQLGASPTIDPLVLVGEFQTDAAANYQDPNISQDGSTLVFTSDLGGTNKIYYVTRTCQ